MAVRPPLRTALVGYGLAGRWFHAPLIRGTPDLRLTTVVTADPQRRAAAVADLGDVRLLATADALWDLAAEHDLAVVAAPNRHHHPLARAAMEAGLDVVVDKPMAPTALEARDLATTARRLRRTLSVFHNRRWDAEILTLRRLLSEGVLGEVVRVESRFERWRPQVGTGWRESPDPADAGGVLMDLGSHLVDQALHLFGRPVSVLAEVAARRVGAVVDDDVFVALSLPSGEHVHLWASMLAAAPAPRLRVLGTRAALVRERLDVQEEALRAGRRPRAGRRWGVEARSMWPHLVDGAGRRVVTGEPGAWPRYYSELAAAVRGEGPVPVAADDGVTVLEIIEAARRSAITAAAVVLGASG